MREYFSCYKYEHRTVVQFFVKKCNLGSTNNDHTILSYAFQEYLHDLNQEYNPFKNMPDLYIIRNINGYHEYLVALDIKSYYKRYSFSLILQHFLNKCFRNISLQEV